MSQIEASSHFIAEFIRQDIQNQRYSRPIATRFPPEPNGFLHIGHAKALCISFGMAHEFHGTCNLRFDDTNPCKEDTMYVNSIQEDIRWLGFEWDNLYFASEYFEQFYEFAVQLIRQGDAYVCSLTADEMRKTRGTLTQGGTPSPYRSRSVEENLDLFVRMRQGEFADGSHVLRAKIDMDSPNINLRDPVLYRIVRQHHHQTGDAWCIYPMYDYAHPLEDAIENITHSLCSLEFENHRPLYEWVLQKLSWQQPPRQIEFARLNLTRTIMSKRYLRRLVEEGLVMGWDDPRMPTLAGMRRRGYPPAAIRNFCDRIGVSKADSTVDFSFLEHCVREELEQAAPRAMAVLRPVKLVIENWPQDKVEMLEIENHPDHPEWGTRQIPFSGICYIEQDDFAAVPPPKFFRLFPGGEVRLKGAYIIKCTGFEADENGIPTQITCTVDLQSKSGMEGASRKVKGTLHWVDAKDALPAQIRLFDPLLRSEEGIAEEEEDAQNLAAPDVADLFNTDSLQTLDSMVEGSLKNHDVGKGVQFMRQGYFTPDKDSTAEHLVFNRIVGLKDSWAKIAK